MNLSPRNRPSTLLPISYFLAALGSLFIGGVWLAVSPDAVTMYHYRIETVALTHLLVLGFALSVVAGALYQLAPVVFETRLYSERLAWLHLLLHLAGTAGMVFSFLRWNMRDLGHWACAILTGVGLLIFNIVRTARNSTRRDTTCFAIFSSLVWLSLTLIAGILLSVNRHIIFIPLPSMALMHAHAHLGVLGVFVVLITGVSFRLLPMFALTQRAKSRKCRWSITAINVSLPVLFFAIAWNVMWAKVLGALLAGTGFLLYGAEVKSLLATRCRRQLDWGLVQFLTGVGILVPVTLCGLVLAATPASVDSSRWETVYGLLAILGVVAFSILGILQKILPFLVWYETYGPSIGRQKVPAISEMSSCRCQALSYWSYLGGLLGMSAGTLSQSNAVAAIGALFLTLGLAFYLLNLLGVLSHWVRKRCGGRSCSLQHRLIV